MARTFNSEQIDEIYRFFIENDCILPENIDTFKSTLEEHDSHGELFILRDEKGITVAARFQEFGDVCHVQDLVIREEIRSVSMLKRILAYYRSKRPYINKIIFERIKYPERPQRAYDIQHFLGR